MYFSKTSFRFRRYSVTIGIWLVIYLSQSLGIRDFNPPSSKRQNDGELQSLLKINRRGIFLTGWDGMWSYCGFEF